MVPAVPRLDLITKEEALLAGLDDARRGVEVGAVHARAIGPAIRHTIFCITW